MARNYVSSLLCSSKSFTLFSQDVQDLLWTLNSGDLDLAISRCNAFAAQAQGHRERARILAFRAFLEDWQAEYTQAYHDHSNTLSHVA